MSMSHPPTRNKELGSKRRVRVSPLFGSMGTRKTKTARSKRASELFTDGDGGPETWLFDLEIVQLLVEVNIFGMLHLQDTVVIDHHKRKVEMRVQVIGQLCGLKRRVVGAVSCSLLREIGCALEGAENGTFFCQIWLLPCTHTPCTHTSCTHTPCTHTHRQTHAAHQTNKGTKTRLSVWKHGHREIDSTFPSQVQKILGFSHVGSSFFLDLTCSLLAFRTYG